MGLFDIFAKSGINDKLKDFQSDEGARLIDVRTKEEYSQGHIPGSENIELDSLGSINERISDKSTHIFVYCRSGARSARAAQLLKRLGYERVTDLGGIMSYKGRLET